MPVPATTYHRAVTSARDGDYVPDPRRWRILAVALVAMFMSLVGVSIINVVLPSIQQGLGASDSDLQWVLSGYALTFGVVLVAAGRAGDILGRGPLFIIGVALFTLSSVASGLAPDPLSLNIARFVQGLGSGLLNPQVVGMIQQYFRGAERGRAYGALGSAVGISVAIGPVLGGLIVGFAGEEHGWRWTFLVNVPVGVVAILLALRWFPRPLRPPRSTVRGDRDLDPVGALLLGLAVLALLLPFVERSLGVWGWVVLPVGVVLLVLWTWWERAYRQRGRVPMVDLALFRLRAFSTGTLIAGLYFMGVTAVWVLVALYVQNGLGRSALVAGVVGLPAALVSAFSANWAGRRVTRHGRIIVAAGICSALVGLGLTIAVVQLVDAGVANVWWLLVSLAFIGAAQGMVITPNQTITLADVPLNYSGSAGGVLQTAQRIGTAMGLAVITAVAFTVLDSSGWAVAITAGFAAIAAVLAVTLVIAVVDVRNGRPRQDSNLQPTD